MLHLDGSLHPWLTLKPEARQCLIAIVDDATRRLLYAQLCEREGTRPVMLALRTVLTTYGIPQSLYTDRASWAAHTSRAGRPPRRRPADASGAGAVTARDRAHPGFLSAGARTRRTRPPHPPGSPGS